MPKTAHQQIDFFPFKSKDGDADLRQPNGVSRPRASAIVAIAGLVYWLVLYFIPNSGSALLYAQDDVAYFIRAVLISIVALLWTTAPAIGPRFGAKVVLTPLAALISVLALPVRDAIAPILIVGLLSVVIEEEPNRRAALVGRTLVNFVSLFVTAISATMLWTFIGQTQEGTIGQFGAIPIHVPWHSAAALTLIFCSAYVIAFKALLRHRAKIQAAANPNLSVDTGVAWGNELALLSVGVPIVAFISLLFPKLQSYYTCALLWTVVAFAVRITHALIEGDMVRRQLWAMDRLTQQAAIGKSPTPDRLLTDFFAQCAKLILYDRASIWLYNDQDMVLQKTLEYCGGSVTFTPMVRRFGEELIGRVAERAKPMIVDDVRTDPRHVYSELTPDVKAAMGPVSLMILPVMASGEIVGVVEFERCSIDAYRRTDRERIQSLCSLVGMSLSNNRLHQDVMQQAVTDGLTGLYNKRQILKTLADEGARAQRYGKSLSVMMLDLDGFKKFNDTFGHMQGDVLLQSLSNLIRQSIRAADIAGRYGGEEFVVVMPETGREAAWVSAERIRQRVEDEDFQATVNYEAAIGLEEPTEERKPRQITVRRTISIGVATFPADAINADQLLERADEALYAAKNSGRNRVCLVSYPADASARTASEAG